MSKRANCNGDKTGILLNILAASHTSEPRVINVDKNAASPKAFNELKAEGYFSGTCE
jgi:hypothetical protein